MPYYEYLCQKCKKDFEILQKISEAPKKKCPECGGKLKKLISQAAFHLKGGGWYADGYSKKPKEDKKVEKQTGKKENKKEKKESKPQNKKS